MACITKRREKWIVDYRIGARRFCPSFQSRREAEHFLRELKIRKVDNLTGYSAIADTPLSKAVTEYLSAVTSQKSTRTAEVDNIALDELVAAFPKSTVQEISSREMELYQSDLLKRFQASTVNRRFNVLRHFFGKCVDWKYSHLSPAKGLKRIPEPPVEKDILSAREISLILNAIPEWAMGPFLLVSLTGLRRTEAISLDWKSVDLDRKVISVFSKKGGVQRKREIPMSNTVFDLFLEAKNKRHKSVLNSSLVFLSPTNLPINPRTFSSAISKSGKKSGVQNAGLQILRRTLLTDLSMFNQSGSIMQKIAGHSSLLTTQRYVQHDNESVRTSLEDLETRRRVRLAEGN